MRDIQVRKLTGDSFKLFGSFSDLLSSDDYLLGGNGSNEFRPDLMQIDLGLKVPSFSIAKISACKRLIENIEYHRFTCEGLMPLDGDCIIYVGRSSWQNDPGTIQSFLVPRGTLVKLNPGVLHGRQFVTDQKSVNILIILPERTYGNDCEFIHLAENDQIQIVY